MLFITKVKDEYVFPKLKCYHLQIPTKSATFAIASHPKRKLWFKTPFPMRPRSHSYHYIDMRGVAERKVRLYLVCANMQVRPEPDRASKSRMNSANTVFAVSLKACLLGHSSRDCNRAFCRLVALCFFTWKSLYKGSLVVGSGLADNRDLDFSLGAK